MLEKIKHFIGKLIRKEKVSEFLDKGNFQNPRTQFFVFLLLTTAVCSFMLNFVYKPQRASINGYKDEVVSFENRIVNIKSQMPDFDGQKRLLDKEKASLKVLQDELSNLESELPHQESLPSLLKEIFGQSFGATLDFQSIKPLKAENETNYDELNIEMRISADHVTLVNYLRRLEEFSQFISLNKIDIEKKEEISGAGLDVLMVLSALLGEKRLDTSKIARKMTTGDSESPDERRDPFHFGSVTAQFNQGADQYTLQGAITGGKRPTVVINDVVYKIGDRIDNNIVEEISSDRVVLKDGQKMIILRLDED